MTTVEHQILLYGEGSDEDECLCQNHGARLSYRLFVGWICPECDAEERERERDEARDEAEAYALMNPYPPDDRAGCRIIYGKDFTAFQCTMPWWA